MKILLLILLSFFVLTHLSAQNIELSIQANSGLFHYSGSSATSTSTIYENPGPQQNYTNDPYGSKNGYSYGGDIQAQHVSKNGFIWGVQAGYEVLRSRVAINSYYPTYPHYLTF